MSLNCGLIGLPMVGKTTIFNLLTGSRAETSYFYTGKAETNTGVAKVPDRRVDYLSRMYRPRKTTYAQIQFSDVPGLVRGASQGVGIGNQFLSAVRNVDMLAHIVRSFVSKDVPHLDGGIDPMRDIETIDMELLFADMEIIEKRIERIKGGKKIKQENLLELEVLEKCLEALSSEVPVAGLDLTPEEKHVLRNFSFLTEKPMMLVVNIDEEQFKAKSYPGKDELEAYAAEKGLPVLEICGKIEMEIGQLSDEDKELFLADLGITQSGIDRLARASYDYLGLISFLTVGEDEVKAWTIQKGTTARQAAGKVHSDMERGFIRAEVVKFSDLESAGSMAKVREKGLFRLEGKDYIVEDGDIINFRFNV
ncbi:MAG: redox-regulated ATPase YchF [Pelotomaculum sp.]|uniref:Ribosome-binding ATPase YchF n=1 Tax=Pelotomaculum thermopropionicum (strain DSM 13744 / JCM 10971 / SI) TaxID=370438 RepID=A5D3T5_PELTS|nr:redox-regulated ATPase YchF [Pelotomaculum sp.]BAF59108.1 predicted GTPase, probable translation factor [Pelotomaculum thermopropionicum SI]